MDIAINREKRGFTSARPTRRVLTFAAFELDAGKRAGDGMVTEFP
jgi:hypothetical protein